MNKGQVWIKDQRTKVCSWCSYPYSRERKMESDTQFRKERFFDLLGNSRRRSILFHLRKRGTEMTVMELAKKIAAKENDIDVELVTYKEQKRVYVALYQTHLQKLADAGLIRYDKDEGTVRPTERLSEIESDLTTNGSEYPWHKHYLSLAVVSGLVLLTHLVGVPGVKTIPAIVLSGGVTLTFGASGVVQLWRL